ncbi:hypothetical protein P5G64_09785 [Serratia nevei]|nr:hypothetical protein [Serratia nevei]MDF8324767.1 hypothetical protein [Serratia nevei]MDF8337776.1 hypothetical protein [Serratia nevei]MDF8344627.1 hypothetical protein [Serratia nevei]MDF8348806.1 hypothetical protein [Serratia nevei]
MHDVSFRRVRERQLLDWVVWLNVPVRRLCCPHCGVTTEKISW